MEKTINWNKGVKWLVITTHGMKYFTNTEHMANYVKKREEIVISITHTTVDMLENISE